jgi:hypothetical protein
MPKYSFLIRYLFEHPVVNDGSIVQNVMQNKPNIR